MADRTIDDYALSEPCPRCGALPGEVCRSPATKFVLHGHFARQDAGAQRYSRDVIDDY